MIAHALVALAVALPPQARVDEQRLMDTLAAFPARRSALGRPEHRAGLVAAERMVVKALKEAGYEPELDEFMWRNVPTPRSADKPADRPADAPATDAPPATDAMPAPDEAQVPAHGTAGPWHNIIADLPGTDLAHEVLLVGAHFDSVAAGPGADDNASGAAALLEIARVLRAERHRRTIRFVFFNLEEVGLVGSYHYAARFDRENPRPAPGATDAASPAPFTLVGMISLECIGYYTDAPGSQRSPLPPVKGVYEPPTVGDFLCIATTQSHDALARELDEAMRRAEPAQKTFVVTFFPDPPNTPFDVMRSDHAPFLLRGHHAIIVTDTANFRNPNYHKAGDTIETIDRARYAAGVRALAGAVHALARPDPASP